MRFTDKYDWIDALRSGKYEQGRHRLRPESGKFCCLGVRCDIADPKKWSQAETTWYYDNEIYAIPYLIANCDGITNRQQSELARMNDKGVSFEEIAEWIWENIPATVD